MLIKLRFYVPEIAIGALMAVALFGMGMMFESSRRPPAQQQATSNTAKENAAHPPDRGVWDWVTHDAAGFFTLWLVIVGGGQIGLFYWQLRLMRGGIDDARIAAEAAKASAETAKEQVDVTKMGVIDLERAYLSVGPTQVKVGYVPGKQANPAYYAPGDPMRLTVKLFVHNNGRTNAVLKRVYGEFSDTAPAGDVPRYEDSDPIDTDVAMPAGRGDILTPFVFESDVLTPQFFWGYIEYLDIFKNRRTSRYCARLVPAKAPNSPSGEPIFGMFDIAGSDAWRECD